MSKNSIKTIIMVVTIILALSLAGGWIAQTVIRNQEENTPETESCFIVTPENGNSNIISLSAELYTANDDNETDEEKDKNATAAAFYAGDTYTLTANITSVFEHSQVNWEIAFVNGSTQYAQNNNPENYIQIIRDESDTRTVKIRCLQPFMEQINVKASIKGNSKKFANCVCDYEQRYVYAVELGEYIFRTDGVATYISGIKRTFLESIKFTMDFSQEVSKTYNVRELSTLYTTASEKYKVAETDIIVLLEPTAACVELLSDYELTTYTGYGSGTFENFFDVVWAHAENGDYGLIKKLINISNDVPLYQLKIKGVPCGDVVFDLCFNFTFPNDNIEIDNDHIVF